jgi:hypothetical protein
MTVQYFLSNNNFGFCNTETPIPMEIPFDEINWPHLPKTKWPYYYKPTAKYTPCFPFKIKKNQPKIIPFSGLWKTSSKIPLGMTEDGLLCYNSPTYANIFYHGKPFDWLAFDQAKKIVQLEKKSVQMSGKTAKELYEDSWTVVLTENIQCDLKELAKQTAILAMAEYSRREELKKKILAKTISSMVLEDFSRKNTLIFLEQYEHTEIKPYDNKYLFDLHESNVRISPIANSKKLHRHNQRREKKHHRKQYYTERNNKVKHRTDPILTTTDPGPHLAICYVDKLAEIDDSWIHDNIDTDYFAAHLDVCYMGMMAELSIKWPRYGYSESDSDDDWY